MGDETNATPSTLLAPQRGTSRAKTRSPATAAELPRKADVLSSPMFANGDGAGEEDGLADLISAVAKGP